MTQKYILAIDQGTTSTRAIIFDQSLKVIALAQKEFPQYFPNSGWVEHNPEDLWTSTLETCHEAINKSNIPVTAIVTIGITNQRETTIVWDKTTGKPIYNAIVWQDRRSSELCKNLKEKGVEPNVNAKTGLLLDPYFSATKIHWILNHVKGAKKLAKSGKLLFGTVDCFLIWKLTGGKKFVTDVTNAARTMLFNIKSNDWDEDLLKLFDIPKLMLPEVKDCSADFGITLPEFFFGVQIPIQGVAGDQQAAAIGQACFNPGMIKSTYGTGCFALINTGSQIVHSKVKLLTTIAYRLKGQSTYALEGSIFIAGAVVQWLRDGLKIIQSSEQTEKLAEQSNPHERIYLVPAFTGLGAPYWDMDCRGAIFGLSRNTTDAEIVRAALESVSFQTRDLIEAMKTDWNAKAQTVLRVDGGMVKNNWAMQNLADILQSPVDRPTVIETTAKGAAYLAGLESGICPNPNQFMDEWKLDRQFKPQISAETAQMSYQGWLDSIQKLIKT